MLGLQSRINSGSFSGGGVVISPDFRTRTPGYCCCRGYRWEEWGRGVALLADRPAGIEVPGNWRIWPGCDSTQGPSPGNP